MKARKKEAKIAKAAEEETLNKPSADKKANKKTVDNHRQAAAHHMEAAKHHLEAAKHHEAGEFEKAAHSTVLAYGHHAIAGEFMNDDAKHHAQSLKITHYHA